MFFRWFFVAYSARERLLALGRARQRIAEPYNSAFRQTFPAAGPLR